MLVVFDAGYDVTRPAFLLADLPAEVLGWLRIDRVLRPPSPPRSRATIGAGIETRRRVPPRRPDDLADPGSHHEHRHQPVRHRERQRLDHVHPRLTRRAAWIDHDGDLPVLPGTLIRLQVEHLPGDRDPKPVWLWSSRTDAPPDRWTWLVIIAHTQLRLARHLTGDLRRP
ncbi:hypothetical protein ACTMTF_48675 [Nonomuraea sp. ZG12]|uniref:hypothetical protein n=1 Tax=Nonomuraea sp. ZG12 TaxID=3452207 RepID=UPI003F88DB51